MSFLRRDYFLTRRAYSSFYGAAAALPHLPDFGILGNGHY